MSLSNYRSTQVHIQVGFSIGEREFGGRIEPPPPDVVPTEYDVQQIDSRFVEAVELLEEEDARRFKAAYKRTRQDLDEASSGADYAKVIQRAADLEGLIREVRLSEPLRPALDVVEGNFRACLELLPHAAKVKQDLASVALQHELEVAIERARGAYAQRDRQAYGDASRVIYMSLEFLSSASSVGVADYKDVDVAVRAMMVLKETRQLTQMLFMHCLLGDKGNFLPELTQQLHELDGLDKKLIDEPVDVINRCRVLRTGLQRIYQQINPEVQTNSDLKGLLRVDAKRSVGDLGISKGMFDER